MSRRDELESILEDYKIIPAISKYEISSALNEAADRIEALFDEGEICKCESLKDGISQIDAALDLQESHGVEYTGKPWEFCPWCGGRMWSKPIRLPLKSETEHESSVMGEVGTEGKDASEWLQTLARIYPFDHQFTATPNWCHAVRGTAKWAIGEIERLRLHVHALSASNEKLIAKNEKLVGENVKLAERNNNQRFALGAERAGIDKINKEMGLLKEENDRLQREIAALKAEDSGLNDESQESLTMPGENPGVNKVKMYCYSDCRPRECPIPQYCSIASDAQKQNHPDRNIRPSVCISAEALDRIYGRLDSLELLNEAISRQICSSEPDARTLKLYETMDKQHKEQAAIEQRLQALESKYMPIGPIERTPLEGYHKPLIPTEMKSEVD